MTQRFVAVPNYTIMIGWDRPLQHYFITVFDAQDEDTVVYTSMEDQDASPGGGLPWPMILRRFQEYAGVRLPEEVRVLLRADRKIPREYSEEANRQANARSVHRLEIEQSPSEAGTGAANPDAIVVPDPDAAPFLPDDEEAMEEQFRKLRGH